MDLNQELRQMLEDMKKSTENSIKMMHEARIQRTLHDIVDLELKAAQLVDSGIQKKKACQYTEAKEDFFEAQYIYYELLDEQIPELYEIMKERSDPLLEEDVEEYRKQKQTCLEGRIQGIKFIGDVFVLEGNTEKAKQNYLQAIEIFRATEDPSLFSRYLVGLMYWLCREKTDTKSVQELGNIAARYFEECVQLGKGAQGVMDKKAFQFSCEALGHFHQGDVPGLRNDEKSYHYFCLATDSGYDCSDQLVKYKKTLFGKIKYIG